MWEFLGMIAIALLVAVVAIGLQALLFWWLIPLAFPALAFGFWNAVPLAVLSSLWIGASVVS